MPLKEKGFVYTGETVRSRPGETAGNCMHQKGCDAHELQYGSTGTRFFHSNSNSCSASVQSGGKKPNAQLCSHWFAAAKSGHIPSIQVALEADEALLELQGAGVGHTALHWAAAGGHVGAVKWLFAAGSNPNTVNAVASTALHAAAAHGHADVLRVLLDQPGCDREIVNDDGDTALQVYSFIY